MRPRTYEQFDDVYIVSELMDTDLGQIIRSDQALTDEHIQYFVYQILRAIRYIHSANVIHRDLANCDAKICDFGLARPLGDPYTPDHHMTMYVTTRWYRAPEVLLCDSYGKPIDIWSIGCILAELLGRKPLFPGKNRSCNKRGRERDGNPLSFHHKLIRSTHTDWLQLPQIVSVLGSPTEADIASVENPKARQYLR
jgi:mitogen-activated protein kinase 1/3